MFVTFVKIQRREWDSNSLKNSFNNIENTAASVKQWKAVVKQCSRIANGSQLSDHLQKAIFDVPRVTSVEQAQSVWLESGSEFQLPNCEQFTPELIDQVALLSKVPTILLPRIVYRVTNPKGSGTPRSR